MTKTEHYNLPQWAANDPVCREDFNAAFAALDTCYGAKKEPCVGGYKQITNTMVAGDTLVTFDFEPKAIFVTVGTTVMILSGNKGETLTTATVANPSNYYLTFRLSGNKLYLSTRGSSANNSYGCSYLAFR